MTAHLFCDEQQSIVSYESLLYDAARSLELMSVVGGPLLLTRFWGGIAFGRAMNKLQRKKILEHNNNNTGKSGEGVKFKKSQTTATPACRFQIVQ